ncbi:MAG: hypothetical protein AAB392_03275 [Patescibacteria group bacterium]
MKKFLLSLAILVSLAEILLPFPYDFSVFLITTILAYWYIIKQLPNRAAGNID